MKNMYRIPSWFHSEDTFIYMAQDFKW